MEGLFKSIFYWLNCPSKIRYNTEAKHTLISVSLWLSFSYVSHLYESAVINCWSTPLRQLKLVKLLPLELLYITYVTYDITITLIFSVFYLVNDVCQIGKRHGCGVLGFVPLKLGYEAHQVHWETHTRIQNPTRNH